ncbi:MAG: YihY family inner membrane protein [SAR324 cluster bacterium]|nr:YihY family inner membrane protein [SAR324 cluster bacterium]
MNKAVAWWERQCDNCRDWLWGREDIPAEGMRGARRWTATVVLAWGEVRRNDLVSQASGLAFWLLLSIVPVLALTFAILRAFGLLEEARPFLLSALTAGHEGLVDIISGYVDATQSATLGGVGVLSLLIVGFTVLQRVKRALNRIHRVEVVPGYGARVIEYLIVLAVSPILMLLPVTFSALLSSSMVQSLIQTHAAFSQLQLLVADLSGYPIYWIVLFYAYAFLPDAPVRWRDAAMGAVVAGTVLHLAQGIYVGAMFRLTDYNLIYGALALLPVLMVWLFLAAVIFLFGAQLCYVSQNYAFLHDRRRLATHGEAERAYRALELLVTLLAAYGERNGPTPLADLARRSGIPFGTAQNLAQWLGQAQLITPVAGKADCYVPARPMEQVTTGEALSSLGILPLFAGHGREKDSPARRALGEEMQEANRVLESRLGQATLQEVAARLAVPAGEESAG